MFTNFIHLVGFVVFKGGSGQRKLMIVPPEADGYNAQYLKSSSGGGKITMFIVPLQEELDAMPLPSDALEFQKHAKSNLPKLQLVHATASLGYAC